MRCSLPPPLTDDQISAALDGVADAEELAHLGGCASCAGRLAEARALEQRLRTRLYRWDCPPPDRLALYEAREPLAEEASAIAAHLARCASCAHELAGLRALLAADIVAPLPAQAPRLRRHTGAPPGPLLARLVVGRAGVVLRGSAGGPLMAEADGLTLFLDVQPTNANRVAVLGQLVANDQARWEGALVELRQGGALIATAFADDLGSFSMAALPKAPSELRVTPAQGRMVILPKLDLGA